LPDGKVTREKLILPDVFTTIPEGIDLKNIDLDINETDIKELPNNLTLNTLRISDKLKKLPFNLTLLSQNMGFYSDNPNITELPKGFKSNCSLKLPYVTKFPDNFIVNGSLDLSRLKLEKSQLEYLPDNLTVTGILNLYLCDKLKSLPKNLKVDDLYLTHLEDGILPDDLQANFIQVNKKYGLYLKHIPNHLKSKIEYANH